MKSAEQQARDLLERYGVSDAQSWSAGDLVELANLIADATAYRKNLCNSSSVSDIARIDAELDRLRWYVSRLESPGITAPGRIAKALKTGKASILLDISS